MTEVGDTAKRLTIEGLSESFFAPPHDLARVADRGNRRHRVWFFDFDTRATLLAVDIQEHWDEGVKAQWRENYNLTVERLRQEFGERDLERKVQDFIAIGAKPFSILAHHNSLFAQVRSAFTTGAYYPALTSACALGERILNHLTLDLRADFSSAPGHDLVSDKKSFSNWKEMIRVLSGWGVLLPDVAAEFKKLEQLRHRSIHFNAALHVNLRNDALWAIVHLRQIIDRQFGTLGTQPWFIVGIQGAGFIKREYETHPFIRRYFLRQCPFVGIKCGIEFDEQRRVRFVDFGDYGDGELTDEQFCAAFNTRNPASLARSHAERTTAAGQQGQE